MKRLVLFLAPILAASAAMAQTIPGTWELYPPQTSTYQVGIRPPVDFYGGSTWAWKSTIPIQYDVWKGSGPVKFASYAAPNTWTYSYLTFSPSSDIYLNQLDTLSAVIEWVKGNCGGGSPRWSIGLANGDTVFAYYGDLPNFTECRTDTTDQSGLNLLASTFQSDKRYEIQDQNCDNGTGKYCTWASILGIEGSPKINYVALVLDSGWFNNDQLHGDQVWVTDYPKNATVGAAGNTATFVPTTAGMTAVCPTLPATIQVTKLGAGGGAIDEDTLTNIPDQGLNFRIVDCKYMYNLAGKQLKTGTFQVDIFINGSNDPAVQTAPSGTIFSLR